MKVAIAPLGGRLAPVFDVAASLLLVDSGSGSSPGREEHMLAATDPLERAREVARLGADVLICGAISWPLELALSSAGVEVIPYVCGELEDVLKAFGQGQLSSSFAIPRRASRAGAGARASGVAEGGAWRQR